jgi:hypothetical protein
MVLQCTVVLKGTAYMTEVQHDFTNAAIRCEACVPGPSDGRLINVFVIESQKGPVLFEVAYKFASNDNDFWAVISNFGIPHFSAAGSRMPQRRFTPGEAASARQRIEEYFAGPEQKLDGPFRSGKAQFLGVEFVNRWITT